MHRRKFFKYGLGLLGGLAASKTFACAIDEIEDKSLKGKLFNYEGGMSKRLAFVPKAETSDHKKYDKGQKCGQCRFFNDKRQIEEFAPCSFARNRYVPSCGWCKQFNLDPKKVSS